MSTLLSSPFRLPHLFIGFSITNSRITRFDLDQVSPQKKAPLDIAQTEQYRLTKKPVKANRKAYDHPRQQVTVSLL